MISLLGFFIWPKIALGTSVPILKSPSDNSFQDKNPKLVWEYSGECATSGNCFKIEIDNNPDFSSPEKETYSNNYSYSPRGLSEGIWYWRIRAKDKADKWSEWSLGFRFNVGNNPSPSTSNPSSLPQTSLSESAKKNEQVFEIKDLKGEIDSDEEIEVNVLIREKPKTAFRIKGAFRQGESINYFGETFFEGNWSKNNNSYSQQPIIQTDSEGKWEGKIKVRVDTEDSGFKGSGDYHFKVGRYSESGNGPVWSNELNVKINEVEKENAASEEVDVIVEEDEQDEARLETKIRPLPSFDYELKIASVAGEETKSDNITLDEETRVLEEKKVNWLLIILGVAIFVSGAGYALHQFKNYEKNNNKSSRRN